MRKVLAWLGSQYRGEAALQKMSDALDADAQWDGLTDVICGHAANRGAWAGAPRPLDDTKLVVEPRYPFQQLQGFSLDDDDPNPESQKPTETVVNHWYSWGKKADVYVLRRPDGKHVSVAVPSGHEYERLGFLMQTVGCYRAWKVSAEIRAIQMLGDFLTHAQMSCYLLTNMFLESSPRSGIVYLFRKLRPTIAFSTHYGENVYPLCCLCQHGIGYYDGTWAGSLVPTDEVISHLIQMRGDEHLFWKRSNQWPLHASNSGV